MYTLELEWNGGRVEADEVGWKWTRSDGSGVKKGASQGGRQRGDKRKEGKREVVP